MSEDDTVRPAPNTEDDDEFRRSPLLPQRPSRLPVIFRSISRRTALWHLGTFVAGAATVVAVEVGIGAVRGRFSASRKASLDGYFWTIGAKTSYPAAVPQACQFGRAGVFYHVSAQVYIVHLSVATAFLLHGEALGEALSAQAVQQDVDGSHWVALSDACPGPHTNVVRLDFLDTCAGFKCTACGSHFHCDGEYLDGPAAHGMDRYRLSFDQQFVKVDTSRVITSVGRPQSDSRLLAPPLSICVYPSTVEHERIAGERQ
jgi:hypothetical protein